MKKNCDNKDLNRLRLTESVKGAGWASKIGPGDLKLVMDNVQISYNKNVLVGFDKSDDAGVYQLTDDIALVQTLDFFTPIVDDPFIFGQIAAVNSLSDVYAMGGEPITAMNIVAFPVKKFSLDILSKILNGGLSILNQANVQLLGGHSVEDEELKYGLSVTGRIHPQKIIKNTGIINGDVLILTKPLGTGIIGTSVKAGMAEKKVVDQFIKSMISINKNAADIMNRYKINACTDVTGFGLAGHLKEMLGTDKFEVTINTKDLPILPGVKRCSKMGLLPAGLYRNRNFVDKLCSISKSLDDYIVDVVFDPQTSGGLLLSVSEREAKFVLNDLHSNGVKEASVIGQIKASKNQKIKIQ